MNNNRIVLTMVIDCIKKVYFGWNFFSNELSFFTLISINLKDYL